MEWREAEEVLLARLYETRVPAREMAVRLGRSVGAVQAKACRLHLTRRPGDSSGAAATGGWSQVEVDELRRGWAEAEAPVAMAERLHRPVGAVYRKLSRLNLCLRRPRQREARQSDESRSPEDLRRFRRLLRFLVWCKAKTGLPAKVVVSAVLQDGDERRREKTLPGLESGPLVVK